MLALLALAVGAALTLAVYEVPVALAAYRRGSYDLRKRLVKHYRHRGARGDAVLQLSLAGRAISPDVDVRARAARALGRRLPNLDSARRAATHGALLTTLDEDPSSYVRAEALLGLARVEAPELGARLPALVDDPWLGILALEELARHPAIGQSDAAALAQAVRRSLESPDPGRRDAARRALTALTKPAPR